MYEEKYSKVVAQKADPEAVMTKGHSGRGFETTIINVMEDGTERKHRLAARLKKDLVKRLGQLPVENVQGMEIEVNRGFTRMELFGYNGV